MNVQDQDSRHREQRAKAGPAAGRPVQLEALSWGGRRDGCQYAEVGNTGPALPATVGASDFIQKVLKNYSGGCGGGVGAQSFCDSLQPLGL